jgi:glycosyltransferase involved in cell wall biosynthesis
LDIVIPTVRVDLNKMQLVANLKVPNGMEVSCFFIVDNPGARDLNLESHLADKEITIMKNEINIGAHLSRNRGFEAGSGEYVLFLDCDIEAPQDLLEAYFEAIKKHPDSPGFVGSVRFPLCINSFTRAAKASDILTFWDIAESTSRLAWGITANLMIKRAAAGDIRFSSAFPKKGGGEDVDYCLRIVEKSKTWFTSVPRATVIHPWWGHGSHQYRRFARWAYGDSTLPTLHSTYTFRNAPNLLECTLFNIFIGMFLLGLLQKPLTWFFVWLCAAIALEFLMDGIRMRRAGKNQTLQVSIQATLIRLSNDMGRIAGHLRHLHFLGITERFDYFMTAEHIQYERKVAFLKFAIYATTAIAFFVLLG